MRKAADEHHRGAHCPGQPRQAARKSDKEIGVLNPASAFQQGAIAGPILHTVRNVVPYQTRAMNRFLVDTHHPVPAVLEESDDLMPTRWVGPILTLSGALHGNADVRFRDRPCLVLDRDTRWELGWVYAEDVPGCAVQTDEAKVTRLVNSRLVIEEKTQDISGVVSLRHELFMAEEANLRVGALKQRDKLGGHGAAELAGVSFLEFNRIRKPTQCVAQRAHWKLHEHIPVLGPVVVAEYRLTRTACRPHLNAAAYVIPLRRVDVPGADIGFIQDVSRIQVAQPYVPLSIWQDQATAVIEIKPDTLRAAVRGHHRTGRIGTFNRFRLCCRLWRRGGLTAAILPSGPVAVNDVSRNDDLQQAFRCPHRTHRR